MSPRRTRAATTALLGNRDTILRLFPFLAGTASAGLMVLAAWRTTRGAGVVLALAPWLSYPALFVLGATAIALVARALARRDPKELASAGLALLVWLVSLGALYLVSPRLDELDRAGTRIDQIESTGASAYLYDLSRRE